MNILLLGSKTDSKENINSYSSMQSYFLEYYLEKLGINVFFYSTYNASNSEYFTSQVLDFCESNKIDHIIALGVNFFGKFDRTIGFTLTKKFNGMVTQIYDGTKFDDLAIDLNFSIKNDEWRFKDNANNRLVRHRSCNFVINWAADRDIFFPKQVKDGVLRVFVDHANFTDAHVDYSLTIFMSLVRLEKLISAGRISGINTIVVKTLTDHGIETVDLHNICVRPYNRKSVPAHVFANELSHSDMFFVTHAESIGLCVLEAAMAGALVFVPDSTINDDLLEKINHIRFAGSMNWANWDVISKLLVPSANSLIVQKYNWENFTLNILEGLLKFKKRDSQHLFPIKP